MTRDTELSKQTIADEIKVAKDTPTKWFTVINEAGEEDTVSDKNIHLAEADGFLIKVRKGNEIDRTSLKNLSLAAADGFTPVPSKMESAARGALQGATLGFADEASGVLSAINPFSDKTYAQSRDESRALNEAAQLENPKTYLAGNVGGSLASGIATGGLGAATMPARLGMAAGQGALAGLGGAEGSLGEQSVDTLKGGLYGLIGGGVGEGIGVGVKAIGQAASKGSNSSAFKAANFKGKERTAILSRSGTVDETVQKVGSKIKELDVLDSSPKLQLDKINDKLDEVGAQISNTKNEVSSLLPGSQASVTSDILVPLESRLGNSTAAEEALAEIQKIASKTTKGNDDVGIKELYELRDEMAKKAKFKKFEGRTESEDAAREVYVEINKFVDGKISQKSNELSQMTLSPEVQRQKDILDKYKELRSSYNVLKDMKPGNVAEAGREVAQKGRLLDTLAATAGGGVAMLNPLAAIPTVAGIYLSKKAIEVVKDPVAMSTLLSRISKYAQVNPQVANMIRGSKNGVINVINLYVDDPAFKKAVDDNQGQ